MSTSLSAQQSLQQNAIVPVLRHWEGKAILILIICIYNRAGGKETQGNRCTNTQQTASKAAEKSKEAASLFKTQMGEGVKWER